MINVSDVVDFVSFVEHWKKLYTSVVHNLKMTNIQYCPFSDLNNIFFHFFSGKQNLLSMWTNRLKSVHSKRHTEFIGRQENKGTIAELYKQMFEG